VNWEIRPTTIADAEFVYDHIWERGAAELAGYGVSRVAWIVKCIAMSGCKCCVTFLRDGVIAAILGVEKRGAAGITWCQVTVDGERDIVALTKLLRRSATDLAGRANVQEAVTMSLCVSPAAARWFEFLGYREDTNYQGETFAGHRERRFTREFGGHHVRHD
jgi:hypothetical protein